MPLAKKRSAFSFLRGKKRQQGDITMSAQFMALPMAEGPTPKKLFRGRKPERSGSQGIPSCITISQIITLLSIRYSTDFGVALGHIIFSEVTNQDLVCRSPRRMWKTITMVI